MPLIEIRALPQPANVDIPRSLDRVRLAAASAMDCDPDAVWVTWETIQAEHYRVKDHTPSEQPTDSHDPIVRISAFQGRSDTTISTALEAVAHALAGTLGLKPTNVFVLYNELEPGRVFTGGAIRT